jgi:hypothetical protein
MNPAMITGLILAAFSAMLGLGATMFLHSLKAREEMIHELRDEIRTLKSDVSELKSQISVVNTQVSPFCALVQKQMSGELHHPHPRYKTADDLLEKLDDVSISDPERVELKALMLERSIDMHEDITPKQRLAAAAIIPIMDLVLQEAKDAPLENPVVEMVAVKATEPVTEKELALKETK